MAKIMLTDASITINAIALSTAANSVTLTYEVESVETTSFGSVGRSYAGALQNNSLEVTLFQDFAAANVEATIYPLVGTTTTVVIKPTSAAIGATNPTYTLSGAYLASHTPVAGGVGEASMTTLSFTGGTLVKTTV